MAGTKLVPSNLWPYPLTAGDIGNFYFDGDKTYTSRVLYSSTNALLFRTGGYAPFAYPQINYVGHKTFTGVVTTTGAYQFGFQGDNQNIDLSVDLRSIIIPGRTYTIEFDVLSPQSESSYGVITNVKFYVS